MDRLTKTYADGSHGVADDLPCGENSHDYKSLLIDSLGKYEDTGLTPEQIIELQLDYVVKGTLLAEYQNTGLTPEQAKEHEEARRNLPPCDIGDIVWEVIGKCIYPSKVVGFRLGRMMGEDEEDFEEDYEGRTTEWHVEIENAGMSSSVPFSEIGKTVFFSKALAEKAFAEMED